MQIRIHVTRSLVLVACLAVPSSIAYAQGGAPAAGAQTNGAPAGSRAGGGLAPVAA